LTLHANPAAMSFSDPVRNRQSQSSATHCPRTCLINAIEAIENVWLVFFRNPNSRIADGNACVAVMRSEIEGHLTTRGCVLHRVVEQVQNHSLQQLVVTQHRQRLACVYG